MSATPPGMGVSGRLARAFLDNQLTPLLALTAMLLGVFAVLVTPREEEPQIDVTMANIIVAFPGASAARVESLVSSPMEQVLGEIEGVEHVYSVSRPGVAVLTVQFEVGEPRNDAIVRLYNAVYSNRDWRPQNLGVLEPLIKPKGIDDVPIVTLTLWTNDPSRGAYEVRQVAHAIETQLQRVPGTRNVYTIGGPDDVVHVRLDPQRLAGHGLGVTHLMRALAAANVVAHAGEIVSSNAATPVQAGEFLADRDEVANLIVGMYDGHPVYLQDVADVSRGPDQPEQAVWFGAGPAAGDAGVDLADKAPAATIAVTKQPGTNASDVANQVIARLTDLDGTYIPEGIEATVTRNYGETANDKAIKLIQKLVFATVSVIVLVMVAVGRREAVVVGSAVIVTLAATLFASWAWGFTINRVSLFALIFSIGILVDDAIVVVENIHRHLHLGPPPADRAALLALIARAVDEVGGPTILATFTVIAALLPMAFVSGLMGPYMSPIPINASMGMLISLAIALIFTPWLSHRMLASERALAAPAAHGADQRLQRLFERALTPFLRGDEARKRRHRLYLGTLVAILIAVSFAGLKWVVMKMLPFDNKSEFQVVVNMPEGTALERTALVIDELAAHIVKTPEVTHYQAYVGTAAPINFNGLVRQYYLRSGPQYGDIQVNLVNQHDRDRKSHEIALAIRPALTEIGRRHGASSVQVVEVPPGPPVQAPIVAEVYGPQYAVQRELAERIRTLFAETPDIVDVDDSVETPAPRYVFEIDRSRAALLGVSQEAAVQTLQAALSGADATYVHAGRERYPIPVRLELPVAEKSSLESLLSLEAPTVRGGLVPLSEIVRVSETTWDGAIYHKDLLPVAYVSGDMAGELDSPLYGMFDLVGQLGEGGAGAPLEQYFIRQPNDLRAPAVKWDGEWQITYETFRDMGLAYSVGLILIYLLVVAQFRSYAIPLVIMAPIPLTIIGVIPGHALLGAQFTATSMIGMIALAGIIVRNSILLVDFINQELAAGRDLADAVIRAGAVRAKPIVLTALAAMTGAFFILDDPIFNGLAVSLIFGILVSTVLTLVVIPILYFSYMRKRSAVSESAGARLQKLVSKSEAFPMSHIIIIGAGIGGIPCAYELRKRLPAEHRVTLIGSSERFEFTPSNPWIAVGWRKTAQVAVELPDRMKKRGIDFRSQRVEHIDAEGSRLTLADGEALAYDYLVIATGPKLAFEEVNGLGPDAHTQSVCTQAHAAKAWESYQAYLANPGPIVIGAAQGASCFGPAYEVAMIIDADLRKRKLRDRAPMTFVTSEPYIGHMGLGGVGDSKGLMESELRQRHIRWITNARITNVVANEMTVAEVGDDGAVCKEHTLPFKFSMVIPAFKGVDPVAQVPGLCNPRGFVLIDDHQRNPKYRNTFSAGVCVAIPPVETTPVPTGAPKTGYMIESMVSAVCENIVAEIEGRPAQARATWNAICLADFGDTGAAFVALPQIPPRNVTWTKLGKWVHVAKIAFEKYFIHKVKSGDTAPVYEKYVLKALGIGTLKGSG